MNQGNLVEIQSISSEVSWHALLTITSTDPNVDPFRIVDNTVPITSRGQVYNPFPFDIVLPSDDGQSIPSLTLTIANVDADLARVFRAQLDPPFVKVEVISSKYPDEVERALDYLVLRSFQMDGMKIVCHLEVANIMSRVFPASEYNPSEFPGLFR